jgi:pimeloyl-ACP methyl ester carboxylesterase
MPTVQVNDIQMFYELRGEGQPLVLILGMTLDVSEVEPIIGWLAERYRVLTFDNRGAGRTDKPDIPYTIEMMANDTLGLMDAVGIERANVLGISLGGRIALALTLAHPERVEKLALVSTSARVHRRGWRFRVLGLLSSMSMLQGKYPQPRYAFVRQRDASTTFNCTDRLPEIQASTVLMHGKKDKTAPFALAEEMQRGIRGAKLLPFAGGHLFFLLRERQRFLDATAAFLGR